MYNLGKNSYPVKRHALDQVLKGLNHSKVVALVGPRGVGKTTLCRYLSEKLGMRYVSLDDPLWRDYARNYPSKFVEEMDGGIIDEVQKFPELINAIKYLVDFDEKLGRFLITSSVNLFTIGVAPDSMAGRVANIKIYPLSIGEVQGLDRSNSLVDFALHGSFPSQYRVPKSYDLRHRLMAGGYPESLAFYPKSLHRKWYTRHISEVFKRDLADVRRGYEICDLEKLLKIIALSTSGNLEADDWSAALQVSKEKLLNSLEILENLLFIRGLRPWRKDTTIIPFTKIPKIHFLDSGLRFALIERDPPFVFTDKKLYLSVLKSFVYSEVLKMARASKESIRLAYYSGKSTEVDIIIKGWNEKIAAIQVTAGSDLSDQDFRSLKTVQKAYGDDFTNGVLLYDGEEVVSYGDRHYAMPFRMLWSDCKSLLSTSDLLDVAQGGA